MEVQIVDLMKAVENNDVADVTRLLRLSLSVNDCDAGRETPLHRAAKVGSVEMCHHLIKSGASLQGIDNQGRTPLHLAVLRNSAEVVSVLLQSGADVDKQDAHGLTALHTASKQGSLSIVNMLLAAHADPNRKDSKNITPLHLAAGFGRVDICKVLIRAGADPLAQSVSHAPAILWAIIGNQPNALQYLVANCPSSLSEEAIREAMYNPELCDAFLAGLEIACEAELPAIVSLSDDSKEQILMKAAQHGHSVLCKWLIEHGISPNSRDQHNNNSTPLHYAVRGGHHDTVKALLDMGADPNAVDDSGRSPEVSTIESDVRAHHIGTEPQV